MAYHEMPTPNLVTTKRTNFYKIVETTALRAINMAKFDPGAPSVPLMGAES